MTNPGNMIVQLHHGAIFLAKRFAGGAGLAVDPQAGTIIMRRPQKEILEKYAYLLFTHSN